MGVAYQGLMKKNVATLSVVCGAMAPFRQRFIIFREPLAIDGGYDWVWLSEPPRPLTRYVEDCSACWFGCGLAIVA